MFPYSVYLRVVQYGHTMYSFTKFKNFLKNHKKQCGLSEEPESSEFWALLPSSYNLTHTERYKEQPCFGGLAYTSVPTEGIPTQAVKIYDKTLDFTFLKKYILNNSPIKICPLKLTPDGEFLVNISFQYLVELKDEVHRYERKGLYTIRSSSKMLPYSDIIPSYGFMFGMQFLNAVAPMFTQYVFDVENYKFVKSEHSVTQYDWLTYPPFYQIGTLYVLELDSFIKIGHTHKLGNRLGTYRTGSTTVNLLYSESGSILKEQLYHKLYNNKSEKYKKEDVYEVINKLASLQDPFDSYIDSYFNPIEGYFDDW